MPIDVEARVRTGLLARWLTCICAAIGGTSLLILGCLPADVDVTALECIYSVLLGTLLGSAVGGLAALYLGSPLSPGYFVLLCAGAGACLPYAVALLFVAIHARLDDSLTSGMLFASTYLIPLACAVGGLVVGRRFRGFAQGAQQPAMVGCLIGLIAGGLFLAIVQTPARPEWEIQGMALLGMALVGSVCGAAWGAERLHGHGFQPD
jgi:hypothetical protein